MSEILLIDGSSIFFRAFHAIRDMRRSDGMATNAVFGYINTLRTVMKDYKPTEMVVAFDLPQPTFRHKAFKAYKANRVKPPDELIAQIPYIKKVTEKLGITQVELSGYEADDLIGTMSIHLAEQGNDVIIVSSDKDLFQLVSSSVRILRLAPMGKTKVYGIEEVKERYGVAPEQIADVFALMGDASDNIPGVPGVGEKTAIALIQQYGTLETIYEHLDEIKGKKRQENIRNNKEAAFQSRDLVVLATAAPIDLSDGFTRIKPVDKDDLLAFYEELNFKGFANELKRDGGAAKTVKKVETNYVTVSTLKQLEQVVDCVMQKGSCAIDTETTSLNILDARMVGMSISVEDNQGWYIPVGHTEPGNLPREEAYALLRKIIESDEISKTGHNLKYDLHIFLNEGFNLRGIRDDSLIASYLAQSYRSGRKLDDLARDELGMEMTPITELIGTGRDQKCMADVPINVVSPYACEDSDSALQLKNILGLAIKEYKMDFLYNEIEIPLLSILAAIERKGILVDSSVLQQQSEQMETEMAVLVSDIFKSTGREFNINSPSQLAQILYDDLKLLSGRKRSTRADILEKLASNGVEVARQILDYRHRKKIKSTYLDALQKLIRKDTGRVHTTYNQAVVNTGRISSSDPNLQNIPIRTELGKRVRSAFVASEGCVLISLDYSQVELRILAHVSQDPGLLSAFTKGEDIHSRTGAEIFGVPIDQVTSDMRRKAKEINFGLNYGMSPYGLAKRLGIDNKDATSYIETYFLRYPLVQTYMDETTVFAQEHLYVQTVHGRRIPTPGIRDSNRMIQDNARRAAINAPIQGSAADLMKKAIIDVHRELQIEPDIASILLTVHDELVLEVRQDRAEDVCQRCRKIMETALEYSVPTPVGTIIGTNWADLK